MDRSISATEILERLVSFPTVSSASNLDLIEFVKHYLESHGVSSALVYNEDGRKANLYATVGPMVPGGVVLSGHTDVVPAEGDGWSANPWSIVRREGRLYGRGTTDMKGFDAVVLAAVPRMVAADLRAPIHIALSYDEEVGCKGAPSMVREMATRIPTPRGVIVGEPSRLDVVTGHKGTLSFFTTVRGHAVHSSRIDQGVSAVMMAARLVVWLEDEMQKNRATADPSNPFEPPYTTLHCGMIEGGTAANVVAESCRFVTDIRAIPSEDPEDYRRRFETFVREKMEPGMKSIAPRSGVEFIPRSEVPGLKPENGGGAERLVRQILGGGETRVVSYATEAGIFQQAGWSAVVCGPGDIEQAHLADEYIEESEIAKGESFMTRLIERLAN